MLGLAINDLPYITFNTELSIGDIIAVLGLLGAFYIIPRIVENAIYSRKSKDSILVDDINELCVKLDQLQKMFKDLYREEELIDEKNRGLILQDITLIGNEIELLDESIKNEHPRLKDIESIKDYYNESTYKSLTEELPVNDELSLTYYKSAIKSTNQLIRKLKSLKYEAFN